MARRSWRKWLRPMRRAAALGLGVAVAWVGLQLLLYRFVPPPLTPLMVLRLFEGEGLQRSWVPLSELPRHVPAAVLAAEDQRFCEHWGVDTVQMRKTWERYRDKGKLRGASTLSMQTTKNVFLWPGRNPLRKAIELPLTPVVELAWGKPRLAEIYLNIAEWGPGVYGIGAAARHHFGLDARQLSDFQAALLAAVLPSPRTRPVAKPSTYTLGRARRIQADIPAVDTRCIGK